MQTHIVTNSVDTDQVVERTIGGDRHLIAKDVTFIRPMRLAGGYVPAEHVANSAPDWADAALTVNHPRNNAGQVVSADTEIGRSVTVGHTRNPSANPDGSVDADLAVNADRAEELGGEARDIVDALENGEPLEVSSQYFAQELPAGVYDGKHRDQVEGNLTPDSIALLPNKQGVCSLPECGIAPDDAGEVATANTADGLRLPVAANATSNPDDPTGARSSGRTEDTMRINRSVGGISFSGTQGGTLDESDLPNDPDEFAEHYVFPDDETKSDSSFPLVDADGDLRAGNVAAAFRFRDDAPDTEQLLEVLRAVNDEFDEPPIEPETLDEAMTSNADTGLVGSVRSFLGWGSDDTESSETTPAESGVDPDPTDTSGADMDNREKFINEIVANSAITAESLADACDERVQMLYDDVVGNSNNGGGSGGDGGSDDPPTGNSGSNDGLDQVMSRLDEMESQMVTEDELEDVVANAKEQTEANELATEIVANSAEYDDADAVQEDFPTVAALKTKRDSLTGGAALPGGGQVGQGAAPTGNSDDMDIEVDSGVLSE